MTAYDTIFALSSGPGRAGVAVFRLSGPQARTALKVLAGALPAPRRAALRVLRDPADGTEIDRGLILWLPGPQSFTGEDMGELHVHGSRAVAAALTAALAALEGLRLAEPGEFARRAFENGRLDLTAAEGLADLIDAETEAQRRQAVRQLEGAAGRLYDGWRDRLMRALAHFEAALDFADEADVPGSLGEEVAAEAAAVVGEIARHLADGRRGERLREGLRVVIAGPANAGKSTLMNALARRDVAIVSERAGTTRDVIEVHLDLSGYPVILTDTAGLREAADEIEEEGVRRARQALDRADILVWLDPADGTAAAPAPEPRHGQRLLRVRSKWDLRSDSPPRQGRDLSQLCLSVAKDWGVDALVEQIAAAARELCGVGEDPAISRARHRAALEDCAAALARFAAAAKAGVSTELLAEELRLAARALGRLTGRVDVEDLLDVIFADFCIGK
jgi:tRNA modification GTPase